MLPTLLSLVAPGIVVMPISCAINDDKVGIMTILGFQVLCETDLIRAWFWECKVY